MRFFSLYAVPSLGMEDVDPFGSYKTSMSERNHIISISKP